MNNIQQRTLSNGVVINLDKDSFENTFDEIITKFVKPYYQQSNDWNKTLQASISELEIISQLMSTSKGSFIEAFLHQIEDRLHVDFEDLKGTDKIEILFEALDDYVENLTNIINENTSKEERRLKIAKLVENLNLFEISELLLFYAKKNRDIKENCE